MFTTNSLFFKLRIDPELDAALEDLAAATQRTKAQCARLLIAAGLVLIAGAPDFLDALARNDPIQEIAEGAIRRFAAGGEVHHDDA